MTKGAAPGHVCLWAAPPDSVTPRTSRDSVCQTTGTLFISPIRSQMFPTFPKFLRFPVSTDPDGNVGNTMFGVFVGGRRCFVHFVKASDVASPPVAPPPRVSPKLNVVTFVQSRWNLGSEGSDQLVCRSYSYIPICLPAVKLYMFK